MTRYLKKFKILANGTQSFRIPRTGTYLIQLSGTSFDSASVTVEQNGVAVSSGLTAKTAKARDKVDLFSTEKVGDGDVIFTIDFVTTLIVTASDIDVMIQEMPSGADYFG